MSTSNIYVAVWGCVPGQRWARVRAMTWPIALFCSAVIAFFVVLNICDYERRKTMTPAERKKEDDEAAGTWL